jgi:Na+/proline symporter
VLTGSLVIGLDGLAYQRLSAPLWLVLPILLAVLGWWFLFLVLVPAAAKAENAS